MKLGFVPAVVPFDFSFTVATVNQKIRISDFFELSKNVITQKTVRTREEKVPYRRMKRRIVERRIF